MEEKDYNRRIAESFRRVEDALGEVDPDVVELTATGDMLTLTFGAGAGKGVKCILNTQRAVHQLWMAARATAWHFSWDEAASTWKDDKGRGEWWPILVGVVNELAGTKLLG